MRSDESGKLTEKVKSAYCTCIYIVVLLQPHSHLLLEVRVHLVHVCYSDVKERRRQLLIRRDRQGVVTAIHNLLPITRLLKLMGNF